NDRDNDGCADAIEGSMGFALNQTNANGALIGSVNSDGIPVLAGANGQGVGTSNNFSSNCYCDLGIDTINPTISCPFDITLNAEPGQCGAVVTYNQPSATDNCGTGNLPTSIPGYTYKGTF